MTATTSPTDAPIDEDPLAVRDTLPITRRSRSVTRLTIGLLVMFGISAGFLVGVLIEKDRGNSSSTAGGDAALATLAQRFGGATAATGGGRAGLGGGGAGFGGGTTGQIKLIDGTNIYVADSQGNTVKVSTTPSSTISVSQPSSLSTLQVGDSVVVRGTTGSDGTVAATSITVGGSQPPSSP